MPKMNILYEIKNNEDHTKRVHDVFGEALELRGKYPVKINTFVEYSSVIGLSIETDYQRVLRDVLNTLIEKQGVPKFIRNGSDWKLAEDVLSAKGYKLTRLAHFLRGCADGKHVVPRS